MSANSVKWLSTAKISNFGTVWATSAAHNSTNSRPTFNNQGSQWLLGSGELGKPLWKLFGWSSPVLSAVNCSKQQYFRWTALCRESLCAHFDIKIGFFGPGRTAVIRGSQIEFKHCDWLTSVRARAIPVKVIRNLVVARKWPYFFPWPGGTFGSAIRALVGVFEIFWARWKREWKISILSKKESTLSSPGGALLSKEAKSPKTTSPHLIKYKSIWRPDLINRFFQFFGKW